MRTLPIYRITRLIVRAALSAYFRKVEVSGSRHLPADGPAIFAANHPNSITDALVLGLATGRMVHYIAHSGLFRSRVRSWFLRNAGVIPVYRPRDVDGAPQKNIETFSAARRLLEGGGAIGIFPEGTSAEERRVRRLKTGTARMALQTEAHGDWRVGVSVIPVGINFESHRRFRSRVLVRFGKAMVAAEWRERYAADSQAAVRRFTDELQNAIRRRVVDIARDDLESLVVDLEAVYKEELLDRKRLGIPGRSRFSREQWVRREIARALEYYYETSPEMVWRVGAMLSEYRRRLARLRLRDEMIRDEGRTMRGETLRYVVLGAAGLPIALYGAVWNGLPYKATGWIAKRLSSDETKIHIYQLSIGALLYVAYYTPLLYGAWRLLGPKEAATFAAFLPPTGLFARGFIRHMKRRRRLFRLAVLELTHGYAVQALRQRRRRVIAELDAALDEYVRSREKTGVPADPEASP